MYNTKGTRLSSRCGGAGYRRFGSLDADFGYNSDSLLDGDRRGQHEVHQESSTLTSGSQSRRFSAPQVGASGGEREKLGPSSMILKESTARALEREARKLQATPGLSQCHHRRASTPIMREFAKQDELYQSITRTYSDKVIMDILEDQLQSAKREIRVQADIFQKQIENLTEDLESSKLQVARLQLELFKCNLELEVKTDEARTLEEMGKKFLRGACRAEHYAWRLAEVHKWLKKYPRDDEEEKGGVNPSRSARNEPNGERGLAEENTDTLKMSSG